MLTQDPGVPLRGPWDRGGRLGVWAKRSGRRADDQPNTGNNPSVQRVDTPRLRRERPPQEDEADVCVLPWRDVHNSLRGKSQTTETHNGTSSYKQSSLHAYTELETGSHHTWGSSSGSGPEGRGREEALGFPPRIPAWPVRCLCGHTRSPVEAEGGEGLQELGVTANG